MELWSRVVHHTWTLTKFHIVFFNPILRERADIIDVDWSIIRACDQKLIILHVLIALLIIYENWVILYFNIIWLFLGFSAFNSLLLFALHHNELDAVNLRNMVFLQFLYHFALIKVPDNQVAVFRARGEEPVALGDSDVDYHVLVTVEGSLEDHRIFAPDFDDSI